MAEVKKQQSPKKSGTSSKKVKQDRVAQIAYQLWEKAGREDGKDLDHWFEAERILRSHEPYPD